MKLTEEEIQKIIDYEVIVDCYTDEEVSMGWAVYMIDNLNYPFEAEYLVKKKSGESKWRKVKVVSNETEESSIGGNAF